MISKYTRFKFIRLSFSTDIFNFIISVVCLHRGIDKLLEKCFNNTLEHLQNAKKFELCNFDNTRIINPYNTKSCDTHTHNPYVKIKLTNVLRTSVVLRCKNIQCYLQVLSTLPHIPGDNCICICAENP